MKRHRQVSKAFLYVCVCPLDIYTDTNVKQINRRSYGSRILIEKRRVHTSSADVCVECGHVSNTAWDLTQARCLMLKSYVGQMEKFEIEGVPCVILTNKDSI